MTTNTTPTKDIQWDDRALLEAAGTRPGPVQQLLQRHGQKVPSDFAVYQWHSRGAIPNQWRPRLLYALLREQKITPARFFRVGSGRRRP